MSNLTCVVEGCENPRHIFPRGFRATYCKAHLYLRAQNPRHGLPSASRHMIVVLQQLRDALEAESPFIHLDADPRTIRALMNRDWIFVSPGLDGTRCKITGRGLKALKVYELPSRRRDGLCPDCGERPKKVTSTGRKYGYCAECEARNRRKQRRLKGKQIRPDRLCSCCKKCPRHISKTGKVNIYCRRCKNLHNRQQKKAAHRRNLEKMQSDTPLICIRKGCDQPRYYTRKTVFDYCHQHYREYQNDCNARRRPLRQTGRKPTGRPRKNVISAQGAAS